MIECLLAGRHATPEEVRAVTPASVLDSWRNVWKDRSDDTELVTGWRRIQDKMNVRVADNGNKLLCFKSNSNKSSLSVAYIEQWEDIVMSFHCEGDSRHLSVKETIERVRTMWTVNGKSYGIPEAFIKDCVDYCFMCFRLSSGLTPLSKKRKHEHTDSFHVPVKEVQVRLRELEAQYKTVLCARQKYVRNTPYMAEVKDYVCDRAGEPILKNSEHSKKELHTLKRCGCGFRIMVIVPVSKCEDKDKIYVYQDNENVVFQLYAVHSGNEPGELDGNERKGNFLMDQDVRYGMREEEDKSSGRATGVFGNFQQSLLSRLKELKSEVELLERKAEKMPLELLCSASQTAFEALNKLRSLEEHGSNQHFDDVLGGKTDLEHFWMSTR